MTTTHQDLPHGRLHVGVEDLPPLLQVVHRVLLPVPAEFLPFRRVIDTSIPGHMGTVPGAREGEGSKIFSGCTVPDGTFKLQASQK